MNIIFLTIGGFDSISVHDQYPDLLRTFMKHGHKIYVVCSHEKRYGFPTELCEDNGAKLLKVKIGNITQSNIIEKGISTLLVKRQYLNAIKKHFSNIHFDLILYTTPPITLADVICYLKKKNSAKTYLILKDIFPQNAVDLGALSSKGVMSLLYNYFRKTEKKLYRISDNIGCMSPANCNYVSKHNPEIPLHKIEVCSNCLEIKDYIFSKEDKIDIRKKYQLPLDKKIFVYGGNLGKAQDIPFILECIHKCEDINWVYFLIVGDGTESWKIENYLENNYHSNIKFLKRLPKNVYDKMIASCDVGLIFLDYKFTIPNFPSRMLSYMQAGLPVLACTDINSDIGKIIVKGHYGWWCKSNSSHEFKQLVTKISLSDHKLERENSQKNLQKYSVEVCYNKIMAHK